MLKIAICDDEVFFQNRIEYILKKYFMEKGILYEIDTFTSGAEFVKQGIEMMKYQIIFLDINMEQMDGLLTAKKIREVSQEIFIVFVTAYINYTLEGYKVDAIRYILKNNNNMEETIAECMNAIRMKMNYEVKWQEFDFQEGSKVVPLDRLLYIESHLHKLEFYIMEDEIKIYTLYDTLNRIEERIEGEQFVRVHQSYLVNMKYIKRVSRYEVLLNNGVMLDIPKARYKNVEEMFVRYRGKM